MKHSAPQTNASYPRGGFAETRRLHVSRNVKGILFLDYVRMIRGHKSVDWSQHLEPEDMVFLATKVAPDGWYPMESFERMGNAILEEVAQGELEAVRLWGRFSVDTLAAMYPELLVAGDPVETLMRFRVMRSTFFDFEALEVPMLYEGHAAVVVHYYMGRKAEEAASYQTVGFFEHLLELAGGRTVRAEFRERSWVGDARTLVEFDWE